MKTLIGADRRLAGRETGLTKIGRPLAVIEQA